MFRETPALRGVDSTMFTVKWLGEYDKVVQIYPACPPVESAEWNFHRMLKSGEALVRPHGMRRNL